MKGLFLSKLRGLLTPKVNIRVSSGGGVIGGHTLLTAQKYVCNWKDLESAFPLCLELPDPSQRWDYLVGIMGAQGSKDPEMWNYIGRFRESIGQPRRVVKDRVVTTDFVDFIVDQLITETSVFGDFKYHDSGTGTNAEAVGDSVLQTPTGEALSTGTQVETDHDTYKSIATDTYAGTFAITEHGLFNHATPASGTLMDRTKFTAINVVSGNQLEYTFEISFTAGS